MKIQTLASMLAMIAYVASAQDPRPAMPTPVEKPGILPRKPAYKPPKVGAPAVRVAGGARGNNSEGVVLQALVPDHPGITISATPALYWFQSKPSKARFEISVTAPGQAQTILQRTGNGTQTAGIHRINLATEKDAAGRRIELKIGVPYRWTVALVPDEEARSKDIVANGVIVRIEVPKSVEGKLDKANGGERACILAENGIWYDAFAQISELIAANPKDAALRNTRADLLLGVGLKEAAEAARK